MTTKHFELAPAGPYGGDLTEHLRFVQIEAELNGVPPGLHPEIRCDDNLVTTYRWEWEE